MSEIEQSSKHKDEAPTARHAPLLLPTTAVVTSVIPRALALAATISLVAFALYMARPQASLSSVEAGVQSAGRQTEAPAIPVPAGVQNQAQVNDSSSKSTVTVNGRNIPAAQDGSIDKTIKDGDSTSTVHISAGGDNSTNTVNVESDTSSLSNDGT